MKKNLLLIQLLFILLLPHTLRGDVYDPLAVYLTWQRSPETTMTIQWIAPTKDQRETVVFQENADQQWMQINANSEPLPSMPAYSLHRVELTNLIPDTLYLFKVGVDGKVYKFRTLPTDARSPIKFVAGGDMYHDDMATLLGTNRQAALQDPQFALVGGDIAYAEDRGSFLPEKVQSWSDWLLSNFNLKADKRQRWLEWLIAWKETMVTSEGCLIPIVACIGNHDVAGGFDKGPLHAPTYYLLFVPNSLVTYNVLDINGRLSLITLDSGHTAQIQGTQTLWLYNVLKEREQVPFKFALYHVPAYPSVRKFHGEYNTKIRQYWVPLFEKYGLNAAFENHEHSFKRTHPLLGGQVNSKGVVYFGDGAWGVKKPRKPKTPKNAWFIANSAATRHFMFVTVYEEKAEVSVISSKGEIVDRSTLVSDRILINSN